MKFTISMPGNWCLFATTSDVDILWSSIIPCPQCPLAPWSGVQETNPGPLLCVHTDIMVDTGYHIDGMMQGYHISIANAQMT